MEGPKDKGDETNVGYEIDTAPSGVNCIGCERRVRVAKVRNRIFLAMIAEVHWNSCLSLHLVVARIVKTLAKYILSDWLYFGKNK